MEIIKLKPAFKDYLWGGRKLVEKYNKESNLEKVAESWELSNHKDGNSIVYGGKYDGKTFQEYLDIQGKASWGKKAQKYDKFPILIKFIDAKQALSIQVHPDDEYARIHEGEYGKNEFWYILEADPGSFLYFGVEEDMTKEQFRQRIEDHVITDYLHKVEVKKGDCFFIKAGTIHAIGAGIVLAEIQQCSNSTYRVYDFGRVGADGKPRELHIDKAVDVSNLSATKVNGDPEGKLEEDKDYNRQILTTNDYFTCQRVDVKNIFENTITPDSFQAITVLSGQGRIINNGEITEIIKGDSIYIPAQEDNYQIEGDVSLIISSL